MTIRGELYSNETVNDKDVVQYGTPRHSGRFPWGSGDNPYQRNGNFLSRIEYMKKNGMSEKDIATNLGYKSVEQLRSQKSKALADMRMYRIDQVKSLKEKGYNATRIGEILGINESTVRSLLNPGAEERTKSASKTVNFLKDQIDSKGLIEIGSGVEIELGVSSTKMKTAVSMLEEEGYRAVNIQTPQMTNPGKQTTIRVLCKVPEGIDPNTDAGRKALYAYVKNNADNIKSIVEFHSKDGGDTFLSTKYPESISSKRIAVRYAEDGGTDRDGTIELRPGVEDISLGKSKYAQVRIAVDDSHYIKGMAMYSDDLPDGVDILVNSNKKKGTPLMSDDPDAKQVLKPMKRDSNGNIDKDNPFGALIKAGGQETYIGKDGQEHLKVINKLREEGDWNDYSKSLSRQMLGKQRLELIERQLNLTYATKEAEYNEILSLTNPVVKKELLETFADDCDASAVHLKAAALPRQTTKVLLPVPELQPNEIYAPTYRNGEHVALIRYPHGGIFEIPELVVNNNHKIAKKKIGADSIDAVGIHPNAADKLSGADFDGDTAVVIPISSKVKILSSKSLEGLKGFDPKHEYPYHDGMTTMKKGNVGKEMGNISNLITDMTLKGAPPEDLAKAVRHSMVVIDAYKHKLDYKQSAIDNDIETLKKTYQVNDKNRKGYGGASTLLSRTTAEYRVPERKMFYYSNNTIDENTGEKIYRYTGNKKSDGTLVTTKSREMAETKDAYKLSTGTAKENAYADYANKMKALGNEARLEWLRTGNLKYNPEANKIYSKEVASLNAKLKIAKSNSPRERMAQLIANSIYKAKTDDNVDLTNEEKRKMKAQALAKARIQTGANKERVDINDKEWEAIQAGAISGTKLREILKNADSDKIRALATPKGTIEISTAKQSKILSMARSGATLDQIASTVGVSASTVSKYLRKED